METIVVGFSRPNKCLPYSKLIMFGYDINYDHVYIKEHAEKYDRDLIFQASKLALNFVGVEQFHKENITVDEFVINITPENKIKLMQFAIDNLGKPYGILEAFGLALVRICDIFGKKINNPFGRNFVCSTLAAYILDNFTNNKVPDEIRNVNPKELHDFLNG